MKNMMKYLKVLFICSLVISLTSCEDDDNDNFIYDYLVGEIWIGDLGFVDSYDDELESGLYFKGNGLGIDDQVYYDDPTGKVVFSLPFRWNIYNGILSIDYGSDYPLFEIYDVYITGNKMSGILYVDGRIDGPIVLKRY